MERSCIPVLDIIDARSPANQYLIRLLEERGAVSFQPPSEERVGLVFNVLDSLTPQLGIFSQVLGLIREELHGAVYSCPSPGSVLPGGAGIPYFSLVHRLQSTRNDEVDAARAELNKAINTLSVRDEELQQLREKLCNLEKMKETLQDSVSALQLMTEEKERRCRELEGDLRLHVTQLERERQNHRQDVQDLEERLKASDVKMTAMTQLTQDYRALQTVFQSPLPKKKQNMLSVAWRVPQDRIAPTLTYVPTYLQATVHMYKQLLLVQNSVLDDYDQYLENSFSASHQDQPYPPAEKEVQVTFLGRLAEISEELTLLEQQREALEQSSQVSSRTQGIDILEPRPRQHLHSDSQEKVEEENIARFLSQAFSPDETLLNRYAAIIYTSVDNGRIFRELEGAAVCNSCGQKTILCPHKVRRSQEIRLPRDCTHIKICRPRAHVSAVKAKIATSMEVAQFSDQFLEDQGISPPAENLCHDAAVPRFLKDLEQQLLKRRAAPRMLSQDLCLSLAQRLLLSLALQLEGRSRSLPIQETVWQFFNERYVNRDISAYGLADFWAALIRDSSKSKVLRLLNLVLEGDVDPTILCYVLLRAEILVMSLLSDMGHFKQCVQGLYPFLEEAEIERLLLEFTGYSHRCVSPPAVLGFFLHLILQHQEPLIRECQAVLSTYVKTSSRHLTVDELSRAVSELCPQLDRTQIEMSIQHSVTACGRPLFSLRNAAYIAAFQLERGKQHSKKTDSHQEEGGPPGNNCGESEDVQDFRVLQNLVHLLKCRP